MYETIRSTILLPLIESAATEISTQLDSLINRELIDPMNVVTNSTSQHALLEIVNAIRQRTFENALREILDTSSAEYDALVNSAPSANTAANTTANSTTSPPSNNLTNLKADKLDEYREEVRYRLGCWYMARHGVGSGSGLSEDGTSGGISGGSVHEMITLIQVSLYNF